MPRGPGPALFTVGRRGPERGQFGPPEPALLRSRGLRGGRVREAPPVEHTPRPGTRQLLARASP